MMVAFEVNRVRKGEEDAMAHVLITHGVPMEGWTLPQGYETRYPGEGETFSREELKRLLAEADAVLACGPLDADMIGAAMIPSIWPRPRAGEFRW